MVFTLIDKLVNRSSPHTLAWLVRNTPWWLVKQTSLFRFRQTVRYVAKHSPFYREAFARHGINPAKVRFPEDREFYTTPADIAAQPDQFLCRAPSIVFESSGTSGKNKQVYYGSDELEQIGRSVAAGFFMMGLRSDDRVANAFDFSIWIPGMVCHYGLMAAGVFSLAFGKVDPLEVYNRLKSYRFTVVMGEPTWLIRLTELAERHGSVPLRLLLGSAEEMPADAVAWMQRVWQGATVKMSYGSVEFGGGLGFQPCTHQNGYHLDNNDFLTEIIEPDDEGYGEIVFTTLQRRVMPLVRYRTHDVARFVDGQCPCGLHMPVISRLRGRRDELVVASGGNLYPLMFHKILEPLEQLTHDWQVVFRLEGIREVMEVHVECPHDDPTLGVEVQRQISLQYPDLAKNLALGIFDMRVIIHRPSTLRVHRKLKRMVDMRHYTSSLEQATAQAVPAGAEGRDS